MNQFSKNIPGTLGALENLNYLSLAYNNFEGTIPESISNMLSLEHLDLSHNNLSGLIPKSLEALRYLSYFNVSFNDLQGEIPSNGPFKNFTSESFIFNDALCGSSRFHVPACQTPSMDGSRKKKVLRTTLIALGISAIIAAVVLACLFFRHVKSEKVQNGTNLVSLTSQGRISYYELLHATNGYDESNLLGIGSFGSVYKGILANGMCVAVKAFNLQLEYSFKSLDIECEVLRNVRHRNVTKVIGICSNDDFKALILDYMPNGSLENWLYSFNNCLNIMQRMNVMIDVACALEYLHRGYSIPIVHCDLKPSNILLNEDMVAHETDFGIAKILSDGESIAYTRTLVTFGYIAPEYGLEGLVSTRCDIYSYGIMLMEVFTRLKPNDEMFSQTSLRNWVYNCMPNAVAQAVDANLLKPSDQHFSEKLECITSVMRLAIACTEDSPRERMNAIDVLAALKKIKVQLLPYCEATKKNIQVLKFY